MTRLTTGIVELLHRLGVSSSEERTFFPWEKPFTLLSHSTRTEDAEHSLPSPLFKMSDGWVARLFSGKQQQEIAGASKARSFYRMVGIQRFIDKLDENISRRTFDANQLLVLNHQRLERFRQAYWLGELFAYSAVEELASLAAVSNNDWNDVIGNVGEQQSLHVKYSMKPQTRLARDSTATWLEAPHSAQPPQQPTIPFAPLSDTIKFGICKLLSASLAWFFTGDDLLLKETQRLLDDWFFTQTPRDLRVIRFSASENLRKRGWFLCFSLTLQNHSRETHSTIFSA